MNTVLDVKEKNEQNKIPALLEQISFEKVQKIEKAIHLFDSVFRHFPETSFRKWQVLSEQTKYALGL